MKTMTTMLSILALTGVAMAQPTKTPPPPAPKAPAPTPAPTPAKPGPTATTPAAPEMPKPPAEIAAMLKQMGKRMSCTGQGLGPDMKTMVPFKGTGTHKVAMDGWFIQGSMTGTAGTGKTAHKMKMESFMTYDPATSKWRSIGVMNDGSTSVGTADFKDGKWESVAEWSGPMGKAQFKEHGDMTDAKAGMKMWGEMSMDGGKTWTKVFESTCKK